MLRLLLVLLLTLNAAGPAAAGVMNVAPGDAGQSQHSGHEGMSGMTQDGDQAGHPDGDCCDEATGDCQCSCTLHQPAAFRIAILNRHDGNAPAPAAPAKSQRPSDTVTTLFRPPA